MLALDLLPYAPAGRFTGEPARNAFVELHNVVAAAALPGDFGPADRVRISRQRGVDLARAFRDERIGLYARVLRGRLGDDGDLGRADRRLLDHLARTLALSAADLRPAHRQAFGGAALAALADGVLSAEERLLLLKLQHALGLDPALADGAYSVLAREHVVRDLARRLVDGGLSPDDEAAVLALAHRLSLDLPDDLRAVLARSRTLWDLVSAPLREADVSMALPHGETGRAEVGGRWGAVHGGRFERAVGAVALATGETAGVRFPRAALRGDLREGSIVLTDRRLLLRTPRGIPDELRLRQVAQILRFRDGTVVRTEAGRFVFLDPSGDNNAFYTVLHRTLFGDGGPD